MLINPESIQISQEIWKSKYRLYKIHTDEFEKSPAESQIRVARFLARDEPQYQRFINVLGSYEMLPAGRVLAGSGSGRAVTLSNCYVMGRIEDSMSGIMQSLHESALTLQQGGGIGMDFSTIRPRGFYVKGVGALASGPCTFMDMWDSMCKTVMSAGERRGAMMGTLRCDHPDIFEFINAKRDPLRWRNFNVSVLCTDAFMHAVQLNLDFDLRFNNRVTQSVKARAIWENILKNTYEMADPGVIFIDRMNDDNNLTGLEHISATNPCGEQPLPPYGSCILGSINLTQFVKEPFGPMAVLKLDRLKEVAGIGAELLDRVVDMNNYPLAMQKDESLYKRRIGLGITGLASTLAMLGIRYGSEQAQILTRRIMEIICKAAYAKSEEIATQFGAAPIFQSFEDVSDIVGFSERKGFFKPRHNSHLISIAPTGTISLYAGNVSSGIEPIFALEYDRKVLNADGVTKTTYHVEDYAVALWKKLRPNESLPKDIFPTTEEISIDEHLAIQAAVQEWCDTSVSKTINLPEDIDFHDFEQVYNKAFLLGLKGCTTYRPNSITGSVLSKKEEPKPESEAAPTPIAIAPRAEKLDGSTYKLKWGDTPAMYITINNFEGKPFEIFFNSRSMEHYPWALALSRMVSAVWRKGGDTSFVTEELRSVFDPHGGQWLGGRYVPSVIAAIGDIAQRHIAGLAGVGATPETAIVQRPNDVPPSSVTPASPPKSLGPVCPKCQQPGMVMKEGCSECLECGYSKCQ